MVWDRGGVREGLGQIVSGSALLAVLIKGTWSIEETHIGCIWVYGLIRCSILVG